MAVASRSTLVVHGRLAMREGRLAAGRNGRHGLQVMSFEQAAVRLAGVFARPIDDESLRAAIQAALPATPMGELESIKALPGMIDATLETLKQDDGLETCVSVAWMPASALAASPRRFVRLLGLNSSRWPRRIAEDRLIPDHIIPPPELDLLPVNLADRRDFETILATTAGTIVLSRARRETDRLMARPQEFAANPQAVGAQGCWRDWRQAEITPHDGLVRADHPLILAILGRTQSASSLRRLLRNPLSFVWFYAFGWREPQSSAEPLVLDTLGIGDLVHMVLDRALRDLEAGGGLAAADAQTVEAAVARAAQAVAGDWESERPVLPDVIWSRTLDDARVMAGRALTLTAEGRPAVVVDWKSDVSPASGTLDHYRAQVRAYLNMTSAERGLIVLMTSGAVIPVLPTTLTESEAA